MKKTLKNFNFNEKAVVLRCDFNVSIKNGKIIDDTRIMESIPTINYLLQHNAKVIILSHLGKIENAKDKLSNSLGIVYKKLSKILKKKIEFVPYTSEPIIREKVNNLSYGKAILLENTRFEDLYGQKESNCNVSLSKYWASLGDIFINDAFATMHRAHASNVGIASYLPSGIGLLVETELDNLKKLDNPKRPFSVIMGGSKVSDKIRVIEKLIDKVDYLYIGGAMVFTFLKASGIFVGESLVETEMVPFCKKMLCDYKDKIVLPIDFFGLRGSKKELFFLTDISQDFVGMDIGPQTIEVFKSQLEGTKALFWNGPLGVYEKEAFSNGTKEILDYVSNNIETTILGGGDIVSCATNFGYKDKLTYLSTGGGATLEYLADKDLAGLNAIEEVE